MELMDLGTLGARQRPGTKIVDLGVFFPWIEAGAGYTVAVRIIHELDQFMEQIPALSFALSQTKTDPNYGAYWSGTVDMASTPPPPGSHWGSPGRHVYRFVVAQGSRQVDWVIDPFAREYGPGKMSAFTLDYAPYAWSAGESAWKVPDLRDLVVYELHLGEFNNGVQGATDRLDYLADLGVNCLEIMPISNVVETVEWGFQPIGYFGIDDRFGKRSDLQAFVDAAHQRGLAVVLDVVFGHTGDNFPYNYLYDALGMGNSPFYGSTFGEQFGFGRHTDFSLPLVVDFYYTVCNHLLDCYHVDGFRYDCVPEYWDPILMRGYHELVYQLHQTAKSNIAAGNWTRFSAPGGGPSLIQCAEQLEFPENAVAQTYGDATWQNHTFDAAVAVATQSGDAQGGAIQNLGFKLGLDGFPRVETFNGDVLPKTAFQYTENHDHPRFVNLFGQEGDGLFAAGDRGNWFRVQPYLIALLLADGVPLLWQGQELCENNSLPDSGLGRVRFYRPVPWEYFYDDPGKGTLWLVRSLLDLRKSGSQFRQGEYYFHNDWSNYLSKGVLVFHRSLGNVESYVAVNFGQTDQSVWIPFAMGGNYREELHGLAGLSAVPPGSWQQVVVPSNYGRVWTSTPT